MYGETRLEAGIFFSPESDGILQDHTDTCILMALF